MRIDQFLTSLEPPGDGLADYARLIQTYLRCHGYTSDIFVRVPLPSTQVETLPLETYPFSADGEVWMHYSDDSLVDFVIRHALPITLFFHNITPADFFLGYEPLKRSPLNQARLRLSELTPFAVRAVANSCYSQHELQRLGFVYTGTFVLNVAQRFDGVTPDSNLLQMLTSRRCLLFVGRLAPNKRQEDLIKLIWLYRQIDPAMELCLIGSGLDSPYGQRLQQLVRELDLERAVHFVGHVTQAELAAYYRTAAAFVSMSEHEGFGIPLMESMLHNLPVVAYAAAAVTEVVENAGVLIRHKYLPEWVFALEHVVHDQTLRQQIIAAQRKRLQKYSTMQCERALQRLLPGALPDQE